jgi:hypothetical protein
MATMTTHYTNEAADMSTELTWGKQDDVFFFSTVVYKNGRPYSQTMTKCVSEEAQNTMANINSMLESKGFNPVEEV